MLLHSIEIVKTRTRKLHAALHACRSHVENKNAWKWKAVHDAKLRGSSLSQQEEQFKVKKTNARTFAKR